MARFEADGEGLAAVLEQVSEMVIVLDLEGRIRYLNRAEPGYIPRDFVGRRAEELLPPEFHHVFTEARDRLLSSGESQEFEAKVVLTDGFEGWYRTRMSPLGGGDGPEHVVLTATNITELKERQEEVDRLRSLLPMCSWCDRIQNAEGEWETVEAYLTREEGTFVSHGICPHCSESELEGTGPEESNGNVA